jgi:2-iminobutanoate/2-iminopropanoate deaminase
LRLDHALERALALDSFRRRASVLTPLLKLQRTGSAPLVPAPAAVRAGDYVFTSSIYPIDKSGHTVENDRSLGEAGASLIAAQTRHCLEQLKTILAESGSALEHVLKADVHLVDPADFYEFKLVWREYFPKDPPARTTVEVGDTLPFHGARLRGMSGCLDRIGPSQPKLQSTHCG